MFFTKPDNSAQGVLALLEEEANEIKIYALRKLIQIVDYSWPEVADALPTIDALSSDSSFPECRLASFLASKIFYHLEQYQEALKFILESGDYFNIDAQGDDQYIRQMLCKLLLCLTISSLAKCIDDYISKCRQNFESSDDEEKVKIHPRLEQITEELLARCFRSGDVAQAVGIAIDSRRLDKLSKAVMKSTNILETLRQCYELSLTTIKNKSFRVQVLKIITSIYKEIPQEDFVTLAKCMFFLNQTQEMAALLKRLLNDENEKKTLIAYQIAIELYQNQNQQFLQDLRNLISESDDMGDIYNDKIRKLQKLLSGQTLTNLHRLFLLQKNKSDKLLFSEHLMKNITEQNSIHHNMVNWTASIMYAGTSDPVFFTQNFDWVAKASHWAKFLASASIGSIHYLNPKVQEIVGQYMPGGTKGNSQYINGGAFFALGIAHANRYSEEVAQQIIAQIPNQSQKDAPIHGICLGLGLISLATRKMNIYDELKNLLYTDNANVGQAAAWSMGMVMAGSADPTAIQEMVTYANDTQHEKIIRAIGIGLALIMYGRQQEADALVDQLYMSQDALLRFGAMYVIGMAYAGSNNNKVIRKLLHVTVSDVDSNVRRAAITNVGFLLFKNPEKLPRMIAHLVQSYNPYVRQGTAMALGIACAGTGNKQAMILLGKLRSDFQDFVRQGAWIASGLICMQERNGVEDFDFDLFEKHLGAKSEPTLTRMGVVISLGIMNAGGRNATVRLHARSGHNRMAAIVGMAMFLQYWYWFPVLHFLTLSLTPAAMIGIDSKMRVPLNYKVKSNAKPSEFGYPREIVKADDKPKEIEKTAVLSTANRASMRKKEKQNKDQTDGSATPNISQAPSEADKQKKAENKDEDDEKNQKEGGASKAVNKGKKRKKKGKYNEIDENEPDFEILSNPSRILLRQEPKIEQITDQRYLSIARHRCAGFIMLEDLQPDTPQEEGDYLQDPKDEKKKQEEKKEAQPANSGVPQPQPDPSVDIEPPPEFELDDDGFDDDNDDDDDDDDDEKGKLLPK